MVLRRRDRGAAAVEFALVLPVLLIIVFGIIDFGRMLNAKITLTEAAREGARAAAVGTAADGENWVTKAAAGLGTVTVPTHDSCTVAGALNSKVVVSYNFSFVTPISAFIGGGGTMTMTSEAVSPCLK
jgi:hypothetical protein